MNIDTFVPLIYLAGASVPSYLFIKLYLEHRTKKVKAIQAEEKKKSGFDPFGLSQYIDQIPVMLSQIDDTIAKQRAQGVTDEQMKDLLQKRQLLSYAANPKLQNIIKGVAVEGSKRLKDMLGGVI